jgi:hypothetical protein
MQKLNQASRGIVLSKRIILNDDELAYLRLLVTSDVKPEGYYSYQALAKPCIQKLLRKLKYDV